MLRVGHPDGRGDLRDSLRVRVVGVTDYLMVGGHAKWQVFWVVTKKGKRFIVEKEFGNDLAAAIALYTKAKAAEKAFVTLRCKNVAFPPPVKYQPRLEWEVQKTKIKRGGKYYIRKKRVQVQVTPMVIVNHRGITWCPYCREFRHFIRQDAFRFEGILVPKPGYYCLCGISSENGMIRKYNPNPPRVVQRTRRTNGPKRRRARSR
jgi:hypothetical protein